MAATTDITFVRASRSDAAEIARLSAQAIEHGFEPSWTAPRVLRAIEDRETLVLVARGRRTSPQGAPASGRFAGFAIMRFFDERAALYLLAVHPDYRRRGIARRMIDWFVQSAIVAGTFDLSLQVRACNARGIALYAGTGFSPRRRIPGYYHGIEDAIEMTRDLRVGKALPPHPV